ncbi:MAG: RluA family pseudouridine synthase [Desulfovibrio sp.]|nr:RluA family pseudouridine synthase [Desulfovibrio sp.]MBI4961433.1 RluA family pseudouridine synthase [Desulfovibrio sp.]
MHLIVSHAEAGQKLLQYLSRVLGKDVPGSVFMRWIRTGQIRVDGKRVKPFDRLAKGQTVRLPPFAEVPQGRTDRVGSLDVYFQDPAPLDLVILAETEDWLVIAKPTGLPVHPGSGWTDSVQTRLAKAYAAAPFVPSIAHRLDRDTSGVLLVAKTHWALTHAHEAFKSRRAVKEYLCWVRGRWTLSAQGEPAEFTDHLEKAGPVGREKMVPSNRMGKGKLNSEGEVKETGKEARLQALPLVIEAERTLLKVRLFTGRTHQIRTQLASRGHPIVGDAKYGGGPPPMYLHAWRLSLADQTFVCPAPWAGEWAAGTPPE